MATLATPKAVQRLIDEFSRLPGIGPKSASRLTFFLLRGDNHQPRDLAAALVDLKELTRFCSTCFNITDAGVDPCVICADPARQTGVLCVVEEPLDVLAIERTREFKGRYHVLNGVISPVEGVGPEDLKIRELLARLKREPIKEIILATNISLEARRRPCTCKNRWRRWGCGSPAWRAACRWAATWNMPMRPPWRGRCRAAARCREIQGQIVIVRNLVTAPTGGVLTGSGFMEMGFRP